MANLYSKIEIISKSSLLAPYLPPPPPALPPATIQRSWTL